MIDIRQHIFDIFQQKLTKKIVKFFSQLIDFLSLLLVASFLNNSKHLLLLKRFTLVFYVFKKFLFRTATFFEYFSFYQIVNFFLKESSY